MPFGVTAVGYPMALFGPDSIDTSSIKPNRIRFWCEFSINRAISSVFMQDISDILDMELEAFALRNRSGLLTSMLINKKPLSVNVILDAITCGESAISVTRLDQKNRLKKYTAIAIEII